MRKFFTLLTMCLMAVAAQAVDIVFDATVDVGTGSSTAGEFTIVKDGITIHVEQGVANGQHYRFYKNKKVTVTSEI
ncbi:MAG: chitobiase, partial [Muribaculaceae bacterium]|nr:chitobiase [Muribaculaceae bacterium]